MFYSIWNVSACQVKRNPPRPPLQPDDKTLFTWVLQNQWQQQPAASHGKKPASRSAASPPVVLAAPPPAVLWYVASSRASNPLVRHDGCALAAGRPPPPVRRNAQLERFASACTLASMPWLCRSPWVMHSRPWDPTRKRAAVPRWVIGLFWLSSTNSISWW